MTLAVDDNKQIQAHKGILAAVSQLSSVISTDMSSRSNSHFLFASVNEFVSAWALGGTASLSLTTSNGQATVGYNCTLGHPGAPHFSSPPSPPHPNPPPPPRRPRHRGPGEREKNRQRAACHQAARASPAPPTAPVFPVSSPPTVSVMPGLVTSSVVSEASNTSDSHCSSVFSKN